MLATLQQRENKVLLKHACTASTNLLVWISTLLSKNESSPGNEMWIKCGFNLDYLWFE